MRYPKNKEEITGFPFEPWHIRYTAANACTMNDGAAFVALASDDWVKAHGAPIGRCFG